MINLIWEPVSQWNLEVWQVHLSKVFPSFQIAQQDPYQTTRIYSFLEKTNIVDFWRNVKICEQNSPPNIPLLLRLQGLLLTPTREHWTRLTIDHKSNFKRCTINFVGWSFNLVDLASEWVPTICWPVLAWLYRQHYLRWCKKCFWGNP